MKLRRLIVGGIAAVVVAGCGGPKKPPTVGEAKDFGAVCDKANEDKRISVEGYLKFPDEVNRSIGPVLKLYQTGEHTGKPIGVSCDIGSQPNQVEFMPKEYTDQDLKVHLANGGIAGYGTKVKVSGDLYFPSVEQEFTCALSNPLIELAK